MSRRNEALGQVAPSNLATRYPCAIIYSLFFRAFIETNASRPEGVGWSRGGTISLKASDAVNICDITIEFSSREISLSPNLTTHRRHSSVNASLGAIMTLWKKVILCI